MDELTKLFSPSCWVPGKSRDEVMNGFFVGIQEAYEDLKNDQNVFRQEDIAYGDGETQKIDIWGKVKDKLLIFIHGGYWMDGSRKGCVTPARCALANEFAFASVGYRLAVDGCKIDDCVEDVTHAVRFLLNKYPTVSKIIVGGHSVGAQLAVEAVTRLQEKRISGLLLYSGCYFLNELITTELGTAIQLTHDQATRNSCDLSKLDGLDLKTLVILPLQEAPKLIEQNRKLSEERREAELVELPNGSHYSIMTDMSHETSEEYRTLDNYLKKF